MNNRTDWVDISRGIGIISVVFIHLFFDYTQTYINSFVMPLFFVISGYVNNTSLYTTRTKFLQKRFKRLMMPYFIGSIFLFISWIIIDRPKDITNNLIGIVFSNGNHKYMEWGLMMWFLPCLFLIETIFTFIKDLSAKFALLIIGGLFIIGIILNRYTVYLPWSLNISIIFILFYYIGFKLKKFQFKKISHPVIFII